MSRPTRHTSDSRRLPLLFLLGALLLTPAAAQLSQSRGTLTVVQVAGRAEGREGEGTWRPMTAAGDLPDNFRTGTGRAVLGGNGGRIVVGSASQLRIYSRETDLQDGQFYLDGPLGAFALGSHLVQELGSRSRLDLSDSTHRVAVLSGSVRVSGSGRTVVLQAGQQLDLKSRTVTPFKETDPWYLSQFVGLGAATVEAVRGAVNVSGSAPGGSARIGTPLDQDAVLSTGPASWAEIGFTGGGYLRLTEQSELKVTAIEKTDRGREVQLQLTKGSAWNVVAKGQGGYKISTPVVTTAVRGTKFRVDATGLVKVMEGEVALPSNGDTSVAVGQEKQPRQPVAPLQLDDLDRFNASQDAARALATTLDISGVERYTQALNFAAQTRPDTVLSGSVTPAGGPTQAQTQPQAQPLAITGDPVQGQFELRAPTLPDGEYRVVVQAARFGRTREFARTVGLDRTPPAVSDVQVQRTGQVMTVTGRVADQSPVNVTVGSGTYQRVTPVQGEFRLLIPETPDSAVIELKFTDAAGNESHVRLP